MKIDTSLIIDQIEFQTLIKKFIKSIIYQKTKKIKEHLLGQLSMKSIKE